MILYFALNPSSSTAGVRNSKTNFPKFALNFSPFPGFNPTASVVMTAGVADSQYNRVSAIYNTAMQKAFDDETAEMVNHMTEAILANGKVLEDNGISIK